MVNIFEFMIFCCHSAICDLVNDDVEDLFHLPQLLTACENIF